MTASGKLKKQRQWQGAATHEIFAENKMPSCTTQGNVSNIAGLPPKFPNCNDKNGQKNHWNHLKLFFFFFDIEVIHRLLCTWQQILSKDELETEVSVGDHWGGLSQGLPAVPWWGEWGHTGSLALPGPRPASLSQPAVLSLEQAALEANPVHWGTLRLVAPLNGWAVVVGGECYDKMPRGLWIMVGCAWASPDILDTFSMASDQT